jgi:hypothetical protein
MLGLDRPLRAGMSMGAQEDAQGVGAFPRHREEPEGRHGDPRGFDRPTFFWIATLRSR